MIIFKNANVFYGGDFKKSCVCVDKGKIVKLVGSKELNTFISSNAISSVEIADCDGLYIIPSCIDINIFPLDKKLNAKTIHTLVKEALKGGVSTLFINPYTQPNIDNEAMYVLMSSIDSNEVANIYPLVISLDKEGKLANIDTLHGLNDFARAIFSYSNIGSNYLYQTMQYAKMLNLPLCVFAFDSNIEQGLMYESHFARGLGLPMITPIGQIKECAKVKEMAKFLDIQVILMSVNIAYCLDIVCHEKNIYSQVGLPHIVFSEKDIKDYDTRYKIMPPLLTRSKREKLVRRLQEKKVELLTSMQMGVSRQFKEQVFEYASYSLEGLEYFFSIAYSLLVRKGIISMDYLIKLTSSNAAELMNLPKGRIQEGYDSDFMIIDLDSSCKIDNPISPYHNMEVYGVIKEIIIGDKRITINK